MNRETVRAIENIHKFNSTRDLSNGERRSHIATTVMKHSDGRYAITQSEADIRGNLDLGFKFLDVPWNNHLYRSTVAADLIAPETAPNPWSQFYTHYAPTFY